MKSKISLSVLHMFCEVYFYCLLTQRTGISILCSPLQNQTSPNKTSVNVILFLRLCTTEVATMVRGPSDFCGFSLTDHVPVLLGPRKKNNKFTNI